jgi:hypothetical protein
LQFSRTADSLTVIVERKDPAQLNIELRPAVSPRAQVLGVTLNGRPAQFHLEPHANDQHVVVDANLASGTTTIKIRLRNDFALTYAGRLPLLGEASQGLRVLSETWSPSHEALTLETEGLPGHTYVISVWGREQIKSIDGAQLTADGLIEETFPAASGGAKTQKQTATIHFANPAQKTKH